MLCPVHAGRGAAPTKAASYKVPLSSTGSGACCGGQVSAYLDELDFHQKHPYGTPVWWKSYHRRSVVETVIGKLKDHGLGLGGKACKAFGLAANTLAAAAAIVTYNTLLTAKRKRKKRKKKAKKRAEAAARLTAAPSQTTPVDQPEASDGETPPRAPP